MRGSPSRRASWAVVTSGSYGGRSGERRCASGAGPTLDTPLGVLDLLPHPVADARGLLAQEGLELDGLDRLGVVLQARVAGDGRVDELLGRRHDVRRADAV